MKLSSGGLTTKRNLLFTHHYFSAGDTPEVKTLGWQKCSERPRPHGRVRNLCEAVVPTIGFRPKKACKNQGNKSGKGFDKASRVRLLEDRPILSEISPDRSFEMKKYVIVLAATLLAFTALAAQPRYLTLDEARTATRCSVSYGGAAREAQDEKVRAANLTAKSLMLLSASLTAGPELMASWLDELEPELRTYDGNALMAWSDRCKKFMGEHRELLSHVLASAGASRK